MTLWVVDRIVFVEGRAVARSAPVGTVRVLSERGGPRRLCFSDGASCEVSDRQAFDRVFARTAPGGAPSQWEGVPWRLGVVVALTALMLLTAYRDGIPALAGRVAIAIPESASQSIGDQTLAMLDADALQPSGIPEARQRQITVAFERLLPRTNSVEYGLVFRASDEIGANAMALPSGTIVVTDALVMLATHDDELLGVLAHEAGHVDDRHGLRLAVQSSALAAMMFWLAGDLGSIMAVAPTALLNAKYSRDFEREADVYAATLLRARGIRPSVLADMLERLDALERQHTGVAGDTPVLDYLASHPATDERLAFLRSQ